MTFLAALHRPWTPRQGSWASPALPSYPKRAALSPANNGDSDKAHKPGDALRLPGRKECAIDHPEEHPDKEFVVKLLVGGRPLNEPVAWGGPFVMNTRQEFNETYDDYRAGRMGRIPPEIVRV